MIAKRKVPYDFFDPRSRAKREKIEVIASTALVVPGLRILDDFISAEEEKQILAFLNSDACTWRTDLARRCMHFGGTYCCLPPPSLRNTTKPEVLQAPDLPFELQWLIDRFVQRAIYPSDARPEFCIANEYIGSQGISAHTENFSFDEPVVGLSLGSPDTMRFHEMKTAYDGSVRSGKAGQAPYTGTKVDVRLMPRGLVVMTGASRWNWQHEIRRVKGDRPPGFKRTSLTFRVKKKVPQA